LATVKPKSGAWASSCSLPLSPKALLTEIMLIFLMFLSGAIAYALLRVGYDEIEN
jgi:hypothetical protein